MVVDNLDLGLLALFFGLRANEVVMERMKAADRLPGEGRQGTVRLLPIQHLIERERTITELAERMEITQQAASKTVSEMIGMGALEMARNRDDRRTRVIRLSKRAWEAVRVGSRLERRKPGAAVDRNCWKRQLRQGARDTAPLPRSSRRPRPGGIPASADAGLICLFFVAAEFGQNAEIFKRCGVAFDFGSRCQFAQEAAHDFAAAGFRKSVGKTDVVGPGWRGAVSNT